jgi:flagellar biosynthesis protein FlhF
MEGRVSIRTFRAPSVSEALAQVKKELGSAAVILHTRTYKVGGVLGVGSKSITEITATSEMNVGSRLAPRTDRSKAGVAVAAANLASVATPPAAPPARASERPVAQPAFAASMTQPSPAAAASGFAASPRPFETRVPSSSQSASATGFTARSIQSATNDHSLTAQLRDEMAMLRRLVGRVVHNGGMNAVVGGQSGVATACPSLPDTLQSCYLKMLESEVATEIADAVVSAVRDELPHVELKDPEAARAAALRHLAAYIPAGDGLIEPPGIQPPCGNSNGGRERDGRPTTIALVGPTGVGKTTTIAKLAATYKLRMGKRVGLVTADTYRIAAVEQLRTYAGIIGLPLRVALTPQEMRAGCDALRDCDVILLDTAGRSPGDPGKLTELGSFLDAAVPHQVHLVLSSAASEACLRHAVASFAPVGPTHLIYTKLDEAVSFGVLVNIARKVNAKLSFITTGQEVPDHIESGNAHRLASLILEGGAVR